VLGIQPGGPEAFDPLAFGGGWWVACRHHSLAHLGVVCPHPADQGAELQLGEVRDLVESFEVVRPPLVLHPVVRLFDATQLHDLASGQAPDSLLRVVAVARAKDLGHALLNACQLNSLAPENDAVLVFCKAQAQE